MPQTPIPFSARFAIFTRAQRVVFFVSVVLAVVFAALVVFSIMTTFGGPPALLRVEDWGYGWVAPVWVVFAVWNISNVRAAGTAIREHREH
jgi:hypothetical protein